MTNPLNPIRSMAAKYYTDPAIYKAEQFGVMARTWQYAGHLSQLKKAGDYFCFEIAGVTSASTVLINC